MKQTSFFGKPQREHGGILSVGKRRSRRPLSTHESLHFTLRSDFATGARSLLRNQDIVLSVMARAADRFNIRIYRKALCGNHVHFLARGKSRQQLQNFFRVLAGHIAQQLLRRHPLTAAERKQSEKNQKGCAKNQRKFWALLIYTRVVSWGREFTTVARYIFQNTLEALHLIAYKPRKKTRATSSSA